MTKKPGPVRSWAEGFVDALNAMEATRRLLSVSGEAGSRSEPRCPCCPTCLEGIGEKAPLAIHEIVEVCGMPRAGKILATNADEGSGEIRTSWSSGLIGKDARIEMAG